MYEFSIGVMLESFRQPTQVALKKAREVGAKGIQMYAVSGEHAPEALAGAKRRELRVMVKSEGLVFSALCGDLGGHGFARREENPAKIERSKRIVDLALELGSNVVTTHIGVVPEEKNDTYKILQEACSQLAEYAHQNGAYFAIETGPEPALRLKEFLDGLSSRGVAVNLDPANLVMVTDDDPVQAVYTLKDYIVHTHAKDGILLRKTDPKVIYDFFAEGGIGDLRLEEYFREVPLGQGKVDFDAYLKALHEIGYTGFLTIEREVGENPAADIGLAVNFLRSAMSRI